MTAVPKEHIAKMTTAELLALYNKLTGEAVKRFSTRQAGERRVMAALDANGPKARKVRSGTGTKPGRPQIDFKVQLTESRAKSKPHAKSARRALIDWLGARSSKSALVSEIDAHFKRSMRAVIGKLLDKDWLQRSAA